jgi:single-stranded DNA-binding protein
LAGKIAFWGFGEAFFSPQCCPLSETLHLPSHTTFFTNRLQDFLLQLFTFLTYIVPMPSGAISQLMGFVYSPTFRQLPSSSIIKFRMGVSRYDFSSKKTVIDFLSITPFGKIAERINSSLANGDNYICCFCDVKVSKYLTKTGTQVDHVEFIVNDFRSFFVKKASPQDNQNTSIHQPNTLPALRHQASDDSSNSFEPLPY